MRKRLRQIMCLICFICMLSFDVYIKKMMIETLIDFNSQQRKAAADQAKEKKDKS